VSLKPHRAKVRWIRTSNRRCIHKYGVLRGLDGLGNIHDNVRRASKIGLKNCTVQTNFIAICKAQSGEVHLQCGGRRTGVPLGDLVDYAFYVCASRNRNLGTYNHRILGFQMHEVTAMRRFSVDGDDERERDAGTSRNDDHSTRAGSDSSLEFIRWRLGNGGSILRAL
jgi:hypothetical protein